MNFLLRSETAYTLIILSSYESKPDTIAQAEAGNTLQFRITADEPSGLRSWAKIWVGITVIKDLTFWFFLGPSAKIGKRTD